VCGCSNCLIVLELIDWLCVRIFQLLDHGGITLLAEWMFRIRWIRLVSLHWVAVQCTILRDYSHKVSTGRLVVRHPVAIQSQASSIFFVANMYLPTACILSFAIALVSSSPFNLTLTKRNVCDWKNAEPILYHEYNRDTCPPHYNLDARGICFIQPEKATWSKGPNCDAFCEIRTTYYYGTESLFLSNGYCHGPMTCTITDTTTTALAASVQIPSSGKGDVYSLGITGGLTYTWTDAHAEAKAVKLENGECGYFTFLPIFKSVWYVFTLTLLCNVI
jgi:hypothetical protein